MCVCACACVCVCARVHVRVCVTFTLGVEEGVGREGVGITMPSKLCPAVCNKVHVYSVYKTNTNMHTHTLYSMRTQYTFPASKRWRVLLYRLAHV